MGSAVIDVYSSQYYVRQLTSWRHEATCWRQAGVGAKSAVKQLVTERVDDERMKRTH